MNKAINVLNEFVEGKIVLTLPVLLKLPEVLPLKLHIIIGLKHKWICICVHCVGLLVFLMG